MTLRGGTMKTVILDVCTPSESMGDFLDSWKTGKPQGSARISFATPELLWQVLTAKRWQLLKALCGAGPVSIREAARRVNRDVKAVHGDVTALLNAGILDRAEGGGIVFPFDAVKVEFLLKAPEPTSHPRGTVGELRDGVNHRAGGAGEPHGMGGRPRMGNRVSFRGRTEQ